jgi:hypothetical protein
MTQKHPRGTPTSNKHRIVPKTYHLPNVGLLNIDWATEAISAKIFGEAPEAQIDLRVPFGDLVV